jgi:hypothetical protein
MIPESVLPLKSSRLKPLRNMDLKITPIIYPVKFVFSFHIGHPA